MSSTVRGLVIFVVMLAFVAIGCGYLPFVLMPGSGSAVSLPVIEVPGEILIKDFMFGLPLTNTIVGMLVGDLIALLFVGLAWRSSKGWTNQVPGRWQAWVEMVVGGLYGLTKQMAGTSAKVKNQLFPLVASIFLFLISAHLPKLLPGTDSVGIMHCAHGAQSGYPRLGDRLYNEQALFAGVTSTEDQYHACHELLEGHTHVTADYTDAVEEEIDAVATQLNDTAVTLSDAERAELIHHYEELTGYHHVAYFLRADLLEAGVEPYSYVVTPYVRVATTDLSITIGLALVSFVAIQYFGLSTLGGDYLQKFINLRALGDLQKRPLGAIDFIVGLFEIISEFAKVISLAFRLFGNIFAGMVLLFVASFLVATFFPAVFYALETIVILAQALVFAVLTLIFCAQAMVSHHHEEDHGEAHH